MKDATGFPDSARAGLPATLARNERAVRDGFWRKLLRLAGKVPFADDAAAAYFCAVDPATPTKAKAALVAALAYFVAPVDAIPDFVAGLGYTDDATVLAMTIAIVARHITPAHRERARMALSIGDARRP
jgi:uncharacterized membrane protein YkvA (DUF1232 family)